MISEAVVCSGLYLWESDLKGLNTNVLLFIDFPLQLFLKPCNIFYSLCKCVLLCVGLSHKITIKYIKVCSNNVTKCKKKVYRVLLVCAVTYNRLASVQLIKYLMFYVLLLIWKFLRQNITIIVVYPNINFLQLLNPCRVV